MQPFIMSQRKCAPNLKTECHRWDRGYLWLQLLRGAVCVGQTLVNAANKPPNQAIKTFYHPRSWGRKLNTTRTMDIKFNLKDHHHSLGYTTIHSLTFKLVDKLYQSGLYLERKL